MIWLSYILMNIVNNKTLFPAELDLPPNNQVLLFSLFFGTLTLALKWVLGSQISHSGNTRVQLDQKKQQWRALTTTVNNWRKLRWTLSWRAKVKILQFWDWKFVGGPLISKGPRLKLITSSIKRMQEKKVMKCNCAPGACMKTPCASLCEKNILYCDWF